MSRSAYLIILFLGFLVLGCEKPSTSVLLSTPNTTEISGNIMTIDYKIVIGLKLTPSETKQAESIIAETFHEINTIFNRWNPESELSKLNRLPGGIKVPISKAMQDFLEQTDHVVSLTDGRFDPTVEPLYQLWKNKLNNGKIPTDAEIENLIPAIGWEKVHFEEGIFFKDHPNTSLDLGGIVKGHCVDLLVERLNFAGFKNVLVEWGGEIRASGIHPDHRPWRIFISRLGNPNPEAAIANIELIDSAIATSGDYLQNWTFHGPEGVRIYFHIINPQTHAPLEASYSSIANASVLAPNCALADGLATALMMFKDLDQAEAWIKQKQSIIADLKSWVVTREVLYPEMMEKRQEER